MLYKNVKIIITIYHSVILPNLFLELSYYIRTDLFDRQIELVKVGSYR